MFSYTQGCWTPSWYHTERVNSQASPWIQTVFLIWFVSSQFVLCFRFYLLSLYSLDLLGLISSFSSSPTSLTTISFILLKPLGISVFPWNPSAFSTIWYLSKPCAHFHNGYSCMYWCKPYLSQYDWEHHVGTSGYGGKCNACCHGKTCLQARIKHLPHCILNGEPHLLVKHCKILRRAFSRGASHRQHWKTHKKQEVSSLPRCGELYGGIISICFDT